MLCAYDPPGKTSGFFITVQLYINLIKITSRGSWARGFLKDAARSNFKIFKFKEGSTEEIKRYNQDLRGSLLRDDAFHHKVCNCLVIGLY